MSIERKWVNDLLSCLLLSRLSVLFFFFFFNDTATTEIYTLSLHDALPISVVHNAQRKTQNGLGQATRRAPGIRRTQADRKSTRLNSSHLVISYAVFCLKKKKIHEKEHVVAPTSLSGDTCIVMSLAVGCPNK